MNPLKYQLYVVRIFLIHWEEGIMFYQNTLGMEVTYRNDELGWAQAIIGDNVYLGLEKIDSMDPESEELRARFTGISLMVKDIHDTYEQLKKKGVKFHSDPEMQQWGGVLTRFEDPEGNILTLVQNQ